MMPLKEITEAATFLPYIAEYLEEQGYKDYSFKISNDGMVDIVMPNEELVIFELKHESQKITDYITQRMLDEHKKDIADILRTPYKH